MALSQHVLLTRLGVLLLTLVLYGSPILAQLIPNGTFDGIRGSTTIPFDWTNCDPNSTVEVQPGRWNVNLPAFDGNTYLGMVCRGENERLSNSCEEITRELSMPLQVGSCYELDVHLAFAESFQVLSFVNPILFDVYLGTTLCEEGILVARFGPIAHTNWQRYATTFVAASPATTIWVRASVGDGAFYSGHILVDQLRLTELSSEPALDLGPDVNLCVGQSITLDASASGRTYQWQDGSTDATYTVSESGTYVVTRTSVCTVERDTVVVNFSEPPAPLSLPPDTTICMGDSLVIMIDSTLYDDIIWLDGLQTAQLTIRESGSYSVRVNVSCGALRDTINVVVLDAPAVSFGPNLTLCEGKTLELTVPTNAAQWIWEDGSVDTSRIITATGTYALQASNSCGAAADAITVTLDPCNCFMYYPNAFSPNRDGINDGFGPGFACVLQAYQLEIFDRWGNQVFRTEDASQRWDGTFRGSPMPSGVYLYQATYQFVDKQAVQTAGEITLVR